MIFIFNRVSVVTYTSPLGGGTSVVLSFVHLDDYQPTMCLKMSSTVF